VSQSSILSPPRNNALTYIYIHPVRCYWISAVIDHAVLYVYENIDTPLCTAGHVNTRVKKKKKKTFSRTESLKQCGLIRLWFRLFSHANFIVHFLLPTRCIVLLLLLLLLLLLYAFVFETRFVKTTWDIARRQLYFISLICVLKQCYVRTCSLKLYDINDPW